MPPANTDFWNTSSGVDALASADLLPTKCLVLLGEPGIGKSHTIRQMFKTQKQRDNQPLILYRDLGEYGSDSYLVKDLFESIEFRKWENAPNKLILHLFLDSFDECQQRIDTLAKLLVGRLERLTTVANLFLRISSRSAQWSSTLESTLRNKWREENVRVFELAPLSRDHVTKISAENLEFAEAFVKSVIERELVLFATSPLTLNFLIEIWKNYQDRLPRSQRQIFESGCTQLCRDEATRESPGLRKRHDPKLLLAAASSLAAAVVFAGKVSIGDGSHGLSRSSDLLDYHDILDDQKPPEPGSNTVTKAIIQECLETPLFHSQSPHTFKFAHESYKEFLAARFLLIHDFSDEQILQLLCHGKGSAKRIAPQLRAVAAWCAATNSNVFRFLAETQPDILLGCDILAASEQQKHDTVASLLKSLRDESFVPDWWTLRGRYKRLNHNGLARQLKSFIQDKTNGSFARGEALEIGVQCELSEISIAIVRIAMDKFNDIHLRASAVTFIGRFGNKQTKATIRPLASSHDASDSKHELLGAALNVFWPQLMDIEDVLTILVRPVSSVIGTYHLFLSSRFVEGLAVGDYPTALKWAAGQPNRHSISVDALDNLPLKILIAASRFLNHPEVLNQFSSCLLSRLRKHDFSPPNYPGRLIDILNSEREIRRLLVLAMTDHFLKPDDDAVLVARGRLTFLDFQDQGWLLQHLHHSRNNDAKLAFSYLILYSFNHKDTTTTEAIVNATENEPVFKKVMGPWLDPIEINSDRARRERKWLRSERELYEGQDKQERNRQIIPPPNKQLQEILLQIQNGDIQSWWKLSRCLEMDEDGGLGKLTYVVNFRKLPGWKNATTTTKARILATAKDYLTHCSPEPRKWYSKINTTYFPAVAGLRALYILHEEDREVFDQLPSSVLSKWCPAIFRVHAYQESNEHRILVQAVLLKCPEAAEQTFLDVLKREIKESKWISVLNKLPKVWPASLVRSVINFLRHGKVKTENYEQLASAIITQDKLEGLKHLRSRLRRVALPLGDKRDRALTWSKLLMFYGVPGDWQYIQSIVFKDSEFGRALFENLDHIQGQTPSGYLATLNEREIGDLWEWLVKQCPPEEDRDRGKGGEVTKRDQLADFRNSLPLHLSKIGTKTSCDVLENIVTRNSKFPWLQRILTQAQEQYRRTNWEPIRPKELFTMAHNRQAKIVRSGDELMEVVTESLERMQKRLLDETPLARFLWNNDQPKDEDSFSDWVKTHLEDDLSRMGIVLGREVQISKYQRTDIHVTAVKRESAQYDAQPIKLIVEAKGAWNTELRTSMQSQLVSRYLTDNEANHGIYLVAWFNREAWSRKDYRRKKVGFKNIGDLRALLCSQANSLSVGDNLVKSIVIDCSIETPPKLRKTTNEKQKRRRKN